MVICYFERSYHFLLHLIQFLYFLPDIRQQSNSTAYSLMETVIFDPIHLNMSGEYECIASNSKNNLTESKYIIIAVKSKYSIFKSEKFQFMLIYPVC